MGKPRNVRFIVKPHRGADRMIDDGVGDRSRVEAILTMLEDLCREFTIRGWDQPASFGFVYQRSRTPAGQREQAMGLTFQRWELEYSPLEAPAFRKAPRPHRVIVQLVESLRAMGPDHIHSIVPPELIAVVMHTEAWQVEADPTDPEKLAELQRQSWERKLHEHPDRVETRQLIAVDADMVRYMVTQKRGGGAPTHLVGTGASKTGMAGDVPNSLEYFMWLIQGRDPGEWQEWWQTHYDYRDLEEVARAEEERRKREAG